MDTPETLIARLEALITKWRTEAAAEQRVSFCADELEQALRAHALSGATPADLRVQGREDVLRLLSVELADDIRKELKAPVSPTVPEQDDLQWAASIGDKLAAARVKKREASVSPPSEGIREKIDRFYDGAKRLDNLSRGVPAPPASAGTEEP